MRYKLSGLYCVKSDAINAITLNKPVVFALDKSVEYTSKISYVERADYVLNKQLKNWIGKHLFFKFDYATSARDAFEKECDLWHDLGGEQGKIENKDHPMCPAGYNWKCPRKECGMQSI
jgi:hypothetical protein